mmetsp:Transcript_61509/g.139244  ORF Transcript_61509/g.139244 Transcript_61509/m.139244 type:complete len:271 (+) Transcript_61509:31-843(+)
MRLPRSLLSAKAMRSCFIAGFLAPSLALFPALPHGISSLAYQASEGKRNSPRRRTPMMLFNFFGGGGQSSKIELGKGPRVDYARLAGLPVSFGKEAAENALSGKIPSTSTDGMHIVTVAGGCFWGLELAYQRFPGVVATCVGYTQGHLEAPTYKEVCSGRTGHTEAVQLTYDPSIIAFEDLLEVLFARINPTLLNQVGNDVGTQYRHGVYAHSEDQEKVVASFLAERQKSTSKPIVTESTKAAVFWPAEEYHQQVCKKVTGIWVFIVLIV